MLRKNQDLEGVAPDECKLAVLIIDMINDFNFEDGDKLYLNAEKIVENIIHLKQFAKEKNIPVIYVNDNFGKWRSDFKSLIHHCIKEDYPGINIAMRIQPEENDYFVLKPKHSGFFSTSLAILLEYLKTESVVLTGITTDICLLFTAHDAYMRDLKIIIPADCTAAVTDEQYASALELIKRTTKAEIETLKKLNLEKYL